MASQGSTSSIPMTPVFATTITTTRSSSFRPTTTTTTTTTTTMSETGRGIAHPIDCSGLTSSATANYDDDVLPSSTVGLKVPFPIYFYGTSATAVYRAINGIFGPSPTSTQHNNVALYVVAFPSTQDYMIVTDTRRPDTTDFPVGAFPFWDDLHISSGLPQGLFWQYEGISPNRSLSFEWYTSHYNATTIYARFLVSFYEALPGWISYDYLNVTDSGYSATVGIQSTSKDQYY